MRKVLVLTIAALALVVMSAAKGCELNDPGRSPGKTPRPTHTGPIIHQPAPKSGDPDYVP